MSNYEYNYIRLFEKFMRDSQKGIRRLRNGNKIRQSTIENYQSTLKMLKKFEISEKREIRLKHLPDLGRAEQKREMKYWEKFSRDFSRFLYSQGAMDNYVGFHMKNLKAYHRYLARYRNVYTGDLSNMFVVTKEEIPVMVLSTERLRFLISDRAFYHSLTTSLQQTLDVLVVGCTTSLRYSDLVRLKKHNLERVGDFTYLHTISLKTHTETRVKLPDYCLNIFLKYKKKQHCCLL